MNPILNFQWPGEAGIHQTIFMMRKLVNQNYSHPYIRERAASIVQGCDRNRHCENQALTNWVSSNIENLDDPTDIEALHHPITFYEKRLRQGQQVWGDCDDLSLYLATLLKAIGHRPEFRVVGKKKTFHHVLVICEGENLDPTMEAGNYPKHPTRSMRIPI